MRNESMQKYYQAPGDAGKHNQIGSQFGCLSDIKRILEYFPTAVVIMNMAGLPVDYNQSAVDMLGSIPTKINPEDWPTHFGLFQDNGRAYDPWLTVDLEQHSHRR